MKVASASTDSYFVHVLRKPWRLLRRLGYALLALLVVTLGVNEAAVRCDASKARQSRNFDAEFAQVQDKLNPQVPAHAANIWPTLVAPHALLSAATIATNAKEASDIRAGLVPDVSRPQRGIAQVRFEAVGRAWMSEHFDGYMETDADKAHVKRCAELSVLAIQSLDRAAYDALLHAMLAAPNARIQLAGDATSPQQERIAMGPLQHSAYLFAERIASALLARKAGNDQEFFLATEQAMALMHAHMRVPLLLDQYRAALQCDMLCDSLRGAIMDKAENGHMTREWALQLRALLARYQPPRDFTDTIEGTRLSYQYSLAWIFEDPSSMRFAPIYVGERLRSYEPPAWSYKSRGKEQPRWLHRIKQTMGSFEENQSEIDHLFRLFATQVATSGSGSLSTRATTPYIAALSFASGFAGKEVDFMRSAFNVDILRAMLAIEEYKLSNGTYPATWSDIVPSLLESIPQRTPSFPKLIYARRGGPNELVLRPTEDSTLASGYILYTEGLDNIDNGGVPTPHPWWLPGFGASPGTDFVVSRTSYERLTTAQ